MATLRRKINNAADLQSVVRTMKALAAANIGQYEQAVRALADYYRTVELGLGACFRARAQAGLGPAEQTTASPIINAVVFGSDQGLVGQFNEIVADYAVTTLAALPGTIQVWAVGERVQAHLQDAGLKLQGCFPVPNAVNAIAALVGRIQIETEDHFSLGADAGLYVFHNRQQSAGVYQPVGQRLLPLDRLWLQQLTQIPWPTKNLPQVMCGGIKTLQALLREYLFISIYRACAESLSSENASRLAAMERADTNIEELLDHLHTSFHQLRQSSIDEELFDVIAGYEALTKIKRIIHPSNLPMRNAHENG